MALPPATSMFEEVRCFPPWYAIYGKYGGRNSSQTIVSGCSTVNGNVQCKPESMAAKAGQVVGRPVSLEAYTLARYLASEVGSGTAAEKVSVAQAALNRVRYIEPGTQGNILNLLLYRQPVGHPNRGYYGPIHGPSGVSTAPYKRWAATSRDPTVGDVMIALGVLSGEIDPNFNKGADDQMGPEYLNDPVASVRSHSRQRDYWVGPLPGVDPWHTIQYRHLKDVPPESLLGQQLIERGVKAMQSAKPDWSTTPICTMSATSAIKLGSGEKGAMFLGFAAATVAGSILLAKKLKAKKLG